MSSANSRVWLEGLALGWLVLAAGCASNSDDGSRGESAPAGAPAVQSGAAGQASAPTSGSTGSASGPVVGASTGTSGSNADAGASGVSGASTDSGAPPVAGGQDASSGSAGSAGAADAGGPQGELYSDDFEDGDLTMPSWIDAEPELGGMWTLTAAEGGTVLAQTASVGDWVIAVSGDYRWTDQVVEARVMITSEPGQAGIFARVRDTRNYYYLYLEGSNIVLRKRVDNSSGDIQKVDFETVPNTWYTLKLSVIGDTLEGYVDGALLVSGSDTGVTTGGVGVGTSDCTAQFDDVTVNSEAP